MSEPTGKDIERGADLAFLLPMMPYLTAELDKQREQAIQRAMNLVFERKMTGEAAIGAWMEVIAVEKLKKTLYTKIAIASQKA